MFLRVSRLCWRQLLQFSPPLIMFYKMCVTVALCLVSLSAFSEGFFIPASLRKQAPQTTFGGPQWVLTPTIGNNNGGNAIQAGYGQNPKDFSPYQQQQPQSSHQQQQQPQSLHQQQQQQSQPQSVQPQTAYSSHLYAVQATAPKYEPTPFQSVNQPQYAYEGVYQSPFNSYSQSVQLVPCLCPVNREVLEQQTQQLQQQQQQQQSPLSATPTSASFPAEANSNAAGASPPPQPNQKKAT